MTSDSWEEETQDSAIWSLEIDSEDKWNQGEDREAILLLQGQLMLQEEASG